MFVKRFLGLNKIAKRRGMGGEGWDGKKGKEGSEGSFYERRDLFKLYFHGETLVLTKSLRACMSYRNSFVA